MTRLAATVLVAAGMASACVGEVSEEKKTAQCVTFAKAVAAMDFSPSATADEVHEAAEDLDGVIGDVRDLDAHDAASQLHSDAHRWAEALEDGDRERVADAYADVQRDIRDAADACDLPIGRFVSGEPTEG
jgi:hypothetical protein